MSLPRRWISVGLLLSLAGCGDGLSVCRDQEVEFDTTSRLYFRIEACRQLRFNQRTAASLLADHEWVTTRGIRVSEATVTAQPGKLSWKDGQTAFTVDGVVLHLTGKAKIREDCPLGEGFIGLRLPAVVAQADRTESTVCIQHHPLAVPKTLILPAGSSPAPAPPAGQVKEGAAPAVVVRREREIERMTVLPITVRVSQSRTIAVLSQVAEATPWILVVVVVSALCVRRLMKPRSALARCMVATRDIMKGVLTPDEQGVVALSSKDQGITCDGFAYVTGEATDPEFILFVTAMNVTRRRCSFSGYLFARNGTVRRDDTLQVVSPSRHAVQLNQVCVEHPIRPDWSFVSTEDPDES